MSGVFFNQADLKAHRVDYWLKAPERKTPEFEEQVKPGCDLYEQAPALQARGLHLVSTDEKTGIQALERAAPTTPMQPGGADQAGRNERQEYEYLRPGTHCLIANFEVATGQQIAPSSGATRREEDFVAHIAQTVNTAPSAEGVFILEQRNTHQSESLVEGVAEASGCQDALGETGKAGIWQSMRTRAGLLVKAEPRIRLGYTPKHCSWLNQVERWFSLLVRRLLNRASFTSTEQLRVRLLEFIAYFNKTLAKPFKWTDKGRSLVV